MVKTFVLKDQKGAELQYATFSAFRMVLTGVIGGLAFAIALILQAPIQDLVNQWGFTDPTQNSLMSVLIYFLFAVIFVLILIPIQKREKELEQFTKKD